MSGPDYAALHELSIAQWETERTRRADALARALADALEAASALPQGCPDIHALLAGAAAKMRAELRATLNRPNPLRRADGR